MPSLLDRIGVDVGRKLSAEDAVDWAAANGVRAIDVQIDLEPNALETFDERRCRDLRERAAKASISVALHTLSAVNVAEISPFLRDAADAYLAAYVERAAWIDAAWIVVHAGYHFTDDRERRMAAARDRIRRAADLAERRGVTLLLENMNPEPEHAEVHYLGESREEWAFFYDAIASPSLRLSFTANHAHMTAEGVAGWIETIPIERVGEVRLADNHARFEIHMLPGTGTMDFGAMFRGLEQRGFRGHYTNAFGTLDDMARARAWLVERAREAGVATEGDG